MNTCQSALSSLSALTYIMLRRKSKETLLQTLGLEPPETLSKKTPSSNGSASQNGNGSTTNGATHHHHPHKHSTRFSRSSLLLRSLQCSVFITCAAPFGFAALSYISYPAMVLGKSCKLVPVMIVNVVLYHRKFAPHNYLVVSMVTLGITIFMGFGNEKAKGKSHSSSYANIIGIAYLLINLLLDGAVNSTQDEIFTRYRNTAQQMMLWINVTCTVLLRCFLFLISPLYIPLLMGGRN